MYGFQNTSLKWFHSYLSNRKQQVCVNGQLSSSATISLGVPQGSILGPLAFIIYINDLPSVIRHSCIHLYADDTVVFIGSNNPIDLRKKLEEDLASVHAWFNQNQLTVNVAKTKFMLYGTSTLRNCFSDIQLNIGGQKVERVKNFKYLGVIFDENLSWDDHVQYIHAKASSRLYLFRRIRHHLSVKQSQVVFTALVQTILDYARILSGLIALQNLKSLYKPSKTMACVLYSLFVTTKLVRIML